jgi:hypothetical protein
MRMSFSVLGRVSFGTKGVGLLLFSIPIPTVTEDVLGDFVLIL